MFPTFNDIVNRHLKMDVKTINGFQFTQTAPFRIPIKCSIYLPNLRFNYQVDNLNERIVEYKESERKFDFEGKIEKKNAVFKFGGYNSKLFSSMEYKIDQNFKYLLFMGFDDMNHPRFRNSILYQDENLSASFLKESSIYNMSVCTGKKNFYGGAQFTYIPSNNYFSSFFIIENTGKFGDLQFALMNSESKSYYVNFKKFIKIKYDWEIETSLGFEKPYAFPTLMVAWKTMINKCIVHSSVNTNGVVKTNLKIKPNAHCKLIFTTELNHSLNDYNTGFKISFI